MGTPDPDVIHVIPVAVEGNRVVPTMPEVEMPLMRSPLDPVDEMTEEPGSAEDEVSS